MPAAALPPRLAESLRLSGQSRYTPSYSAQPGRLSLPGCAEEVAHVGRPMERQSLSASQAAEPEILANGNEGNLDKHECRSALLTGACRVWGRHRSSLRSASTWPWGFSGSLPRKSADAGHSHESRDPVLCGHITLLLIDRRIYLSEGLPRLSRSNCRMMSDVRRLMSGGNRTCKISTSGVSPVRTATPLIG